MGQVIGDLWTKFFQEGICNTIQNRANEYAIGLYSDYTQQGYHVLTGVEVSELNNSNLESRVIPAGTYAKFRIHGNMETAVRNAWEKIWDMDLDRTFTEILKNISMMIIIMRILTFMSLLKSNFSLID